MKITLFVVVTAAVAAAWHQFRNDVSLRALAERESQLEQLGRNNRGMVITSTYGGYTAATGLSIPGAWALTVAIGWLYKTIFGEVAGFAIGLVVVSFASTSGATLAFLLSRYLFRDALQRRFGDHLQRFNDALDREGAFYLFTLRLIPAVPFFVINVVMGLTRMRVRTFWWVSQLGMLPGTCAYMYAGWSVPSLSEVADDSSAIVSPQLIGAFVILGLLPIATKHLLARFRQNSGGASP